MGTPKSCFFHWDGFFVVHLLYRWIFSILLVFCHFGVCVCAILVYVCGPLPISSGKWRFIEQPIMILMVTGILGEGPHPKYSCITQPLPKSFDPKTPPDDRCGSETWLEVLEATWNLRTPRWEDQPVPSVSNKIGFPSTYLDGNLLRNTRRIHRAENLLKMTNWRTLFRLENPRNNWLDFDITKKITCEFHLPKRVLGSLGGYFRSGCVCLGWSAKSSKMVILKRNLLFQECMVRLKLKLG